MSDLQLARCGVVVPTTFIQSGRLTDMLYLTCKQIKPGKKHVRHLGTNDYTIGY
jgi:hypothetical protein